MWDQRIMRTLHLPAQYLWFDVVEWLIFLIPLVMGLFGHAGLFLAMPIFPHWVFPYVRQQRRSFATHLLLTFGFGQLYGYPPAIKSRFEE